MVCRNYKLVIIKDMIKVEEYKKKIGRKLTIKRETEAVKDTGGGGEGREIKR